MKNLIFLILMLITNYALGQNPPEYLSLTFKDETGKTIFPELTVFENVILYDENNDSIYTKSKNLKINFNNELDSRFRKYTDSKNQTVTVISSVNYNHSLGQEIKITAEFDNKKMRKFFPGKEMDELLNSDYLADWDKDLPVSGKGFKGGRTLRRKEVKEWIEKIKKISNGKSSIVILAKNHKSLMGNRAAFNPFNGNIYVQKGMTEYEIFHESKHLEEFLKLGKEAYTKGMKRTGGSPADDLIRTYKREKHVYDEVLKNSKKFNEAELDHAKWIIDDAIEKGERAGINLNEL